MYRAYLHQQQFVMGDQSNGYAPRMINEYRREMLIDKTMIRSTKLKNCRTELLRLNINYTSVNRERSINSNADETDTGFCLTMMHYAKRSINVIASTTKAPKPLN
jgi:hypothetical protein